MARIPEPDQTPDGPAFEGRLLDRPDDELVDQGAGFDIRTLVSRRSILGLVGLGAGTVALAACSATTTTAATPSATTASAAPTATATATPTATATATAGPALATSGGGDLRVQRDLDLAARPSRSAISRTATCRSPAMEYSPFASHCQAYTATTCTPRR